MYFNENEFLASAQHAQRQGHSANTAMVHMIDEWLTSVEKSKLVGAVFLDLTTAFDVINHCILIEKLKYYGFSQTALRPVNDD